MTVSLKPFGFKSWVFPGGEVGVKLDDEWLNVKERWIPKISVDGLVNHSDIFIVMNLLDALSSLPDRSKISGGIVEMRYLPYARQDRICSPGESFALEVFIKAISAFSKDVCVFSCWDAHSEVASTLIKKYMPHVLFSNLTQAAIFEKFGSASLNVDVIVGPDKGSKVKALDVAGVLNLEGVTLNKVRKDGKVIYEDYDFDSLSGNVLIVDDIGDGMATFVSCGEMLRRTQPRMKRLEVYVTHGIFSRGLDHLSKIFDAVLTANLMNPNDSVKNHSLLKILT